MISLAPNPYRRLERRLGYRFRRRRLLEQAFTHPSFAHEQATSEPDNQRLEYLGDAALGLAAAAALFHHNPTADEGHLTKLRSLLTSTKALAAVARELELGTYLRLGRGEDQGGGRLRASTLADALESVVGAAYLDGGMRAVDQIFHTVFEPRVRELGNAAWRENPKGELQEWSQRRGTGMPRYRMVSESGPPHQKTFTVEVWVADVCLGSGQGRTKREAETQAALEALGHHAS